MLCSLRCQTAVAMALTAVLSVTPVPVRGGTVSAFFVGGPQHGFGFVTGYGGGRCGSMLYLRGRRQTYVSGSMIGRHSYIGGTLYRNPYFGVGFGGYYQPGFSASGLWYLPPRRRMR
jgi:hypothetical protein